MKPASPQNIQQQLARMKRESRQADTELLSSLVKRLYGRYPRRSLTRTARRLRVKIYRDPLDIVARYLRRHSKGAWYRGGHHIARYHAGPGIGFRNFRNDRRAKLQPITINF